MAYIPVPADGVLGAHVVVLAPVEVNLLQPVLALQIKILKRRLVTMGYLQ